ncbi:MOSC domain-containing protein [Bosea sp. PAMC 26642]|uniref:MOSC domain-containing protein n=1 Tax=Bosea sp. (strain PAMC 26642) TaxID=1792307 RepID=UPI000770611E|nr:MOSC domain-containing protein [Bosea sp. PAMC 26642]AMJ60671.1 hypothetical protein AXW83_10555 [Bosea sp. PAMC 26642]
MTYPSVPGVVAGIFTATGVVPKPHDFVTTAVLSLQLDLAGIVGDLHSGATRASGPREPWLPRGTTLRNDRQLSALCPAELTEVAGRLGIVELRTEWLGGNLLIEGLPAFSRIAPGSRLAIGGAWGGKGRFDGGAVLRVEGYNKPCRQAGRALAAAVGQPDLEFAFVKAAASLRGLVLSVDRAGEVMSGDAVIVIPPTVPKS